MNEMGGKVGIERRRVSLLVRRGHSSGSLRNKEIPVRKGGTKRGAGEEMLLFPSKEGVEETEE